MSDDILQSVLGPVQASQMQWIHPHEHLLASDYCTHTGEGLRPYPGGVEYARRQVAAMLRELKEHRVNGLVDPLPVGIGRDAIFVNLARELSQTTGVHVFLATGLYHPAYWPAWAREGSIPSLADVFTRELEEGIEDTGVRPCLIKVTVDEELGSDQEKVLTAAAIAQRRTGVAIHCHSSTRRRETVELLTALGVPGRRIYLAHVDMNTSEEEWLWLVEREVRLVTTNWDFPYHMDQDEARRLVNLLIARGYVDRILVSIDFALEVIDRWRTAIWIWENPDRTSYAYLEKGVIPKLRAAGVTDEHLDWIMRRNPIAMLRRDAG